MSNEIKQRKKTTQSAKSSSNSSSNPKANGKDEEEEAEKANMATTPGHSVDPGGKPSVDLKTCLSLLTLAVCGNERFAELENRYQLLHEKSTAVFSMEEELLRVSEKLSSSQDDLQEALSTAATATRLQQDLAALHGVVTAIQAEESAASRHLRAVNAHFLNVTETWAGRMVAVTSDLVALKAEAREAHSGATERVNEAERRARSLGERLDELADSSARNVRALERSEDEDAKRAQGQLDWNTGQVHKLDGQLGDLARREEELATQLREHVPRARECEKHLPAVEEAVRSILRLGSELSGAEARLEEVTLQVLGTEDSMLKTLGDIVEIRKEMDKVQARDGVLKMKRELEVVKEAVHELTMVLRESRGAGEGLEQQEGQEMEDGGDLWKEEEEEEDVEWTNYDGDDDASSLALEDDMSE
ncbi:hypothetical protein NHX12_020953 [Muraenolepis orangiensis]|uniref:IKBKB interacting protein n=1 Tax=Muraenolepis orangiensis TaxID=630683 RepID=A0A9Q0IWT0_9TELE|nr:hypothetical protein NHX12_020953 [Muraenolepis orangiensis]